MCQHRHHCAENGGGLSSGIARRGVGMSSSTPRQKRLLAAGKATLLAGAPMEVGL